MSIIKGSIAILLSVFLVSVYAGDLPNPDENNLANFHLKDETCADQCHQDEDPSDDLKFEYDSCVACHDDFGILEGRQHNVKHRESEEMECVECHLPHEAFDPKETCTDCHDEDDEELSDFYSMRLNRYFKVFHL